MANFSIENFKSEVFNRGLARPNRFELELPTIPRWEPEARLSALFCEAAVFPPLSILNRSMRIQGPVYTQGTSVDYGGIVTLTFLLDTKMLIRRYFQFWSTLIIEPATFNVGYHSDYAKSIVLHQLDTDKGNKDKQIYTIKLIDAYPSVIGQLDLTNTSTNDVHRLPVSFVYRYWQSYDIKNHSYYKADISGPTEKLTSFEPEIKAAIPRTTIEQLPGGTVEVGPGGAVFNVRRYRTR